MRNKATEHQPLSPSFICPRKSFLWRELRQDSQKIPINILVQKGVFRVTSPTSARENFISADKTNLWFDWTGVLSSGTSSSVHTQVRRVHIKPAKSEEDNQKKKVSRFSFHTRVRGKLPPVCFTVKSTKTATVLLFRCVLKVGAVDTNSSVCGSVRPTGRRMKSDNSS